jgi:peroxiredoxin Q/BCP
MNRLSCRLVALLAFCVPVLILGAENGAPVVGAAAPEFRLSGSDGIEYELSQFIGKKPVVIAWFPKAFTGG